MRSPASPILERWRAAVCSAALLASLGAGAPRAWASEAEVDAPAGGEVERRAPERARPFADRFPNVVLQTHEGRNVRFYDDLLKDKIVLINFMYATCKER